MEPETLLEVGTMPKVKAVILRRAPKAPYSRVLHDERCIYDEMMLPEYSSYAIVAGYMPSPREETRRASSRPSAIAINHAPLASFLERVTGVKIPPVPCLMVYPFKPLVIFRDKIVAELHRRRAKTRSNPEDSAETDESPKLATAEKTTGKDTQETEDDPSDQDFLPFLQCLVDFIRVNLKDLLETQERVTSKSLKDIGFDELSLLFQPGSPIIENCVSKKYQNQQAYRVLYIEEPSVESPDLFRYSSRYLCLHCYSIGYDGTEFRPGYRIIEIARFSGRRRIVDLSAFPVEYAQNFDVEARGRAFLDHCYGHGQHRGVTESIIRGIERVHLHGDVFVDFKTGYEVLPEFAEFVEENYAPVWDSADLRLERVAGSLSGDICRTCQDKFFDYEKFTYQSFLDFWEPGPLTMSRRTYLIREGLELLLPPYLLAFSLVTHRWHTLSISQFSLPAPDRHGSVNKPVIPMEQQDILNTIVSYGPRRMDLDDGETDDKYRASNYDKGSNMVVLLHGPPGSGKSSSVRAIAESAQPPRPVLHIRGGELPSEPEEFACTLQAYLTQASRWACLVLFDDAEIYLSERDNNMDRSRIVSIFLNALDNFTGVLFLTTNRVGLIDEALKVRIHVALAFQRPDENDYMEIWNSYLEQKHEHNGIPVSFNVKEITRFARRRLRRSASGGHPWNGRQIRNTLEAAIVFAARRTLKTSMSVGAAEEEPKEICVSKRDLAMVAKTSKSFDTYLEKCRGNDAERASEFSIRVDDFSPPEWSEFEESRLRKKSSTKMSSKRRAGSRTSPPPRRREKSMASDTSSDGEEYFSFSKTPSKRRTRFRSSPPPQKRESKAYETSSTDGETSSSDNEDD